MDIFQKYFDNIKQLFEYEDFNQLVKRIIDLTLDTKDITYYRKTIIFLDWLDKNNNSVEIKNRFKDILDDLYQFLINKPVNVTSERKPLLSTDNLIRSYSNSMFALGPISFEIKEGQIIGLVGENGNGKTTLLRSLCGELQPTGGTINYDFPVQNKYDLRSHLIYIPQRTPTWKGSLLSNLQFTGACYGITGEENALLVQLVIARMGLRKYRGYKWKNLSSGYKMRFELARALLRNPKILLIDEPLANLDILAQQVVLDDFKNMASSPFRPMGIVLSSQQLYEVEKTSDYVIFLKNGTPRNIDYDNMGVSVKEIPQMIIEFESEWSQEQLREAFGPLGFNRFQINGGTYVVSFPESVTQTIFLQTVLDKEIPMIYFRNISNSTRRFFLA